MDDVDVHLLLMTGARKLLSIFLHPKLAWDDSKVAPGPPLNPFTSGNPFLGTKLLGFSTGRGSGALKRIRRLSTSDGSDTSPFHYLDIPGQSFP